MPTHDFRAKDGSTIERSYAWSDDPPRTVRVKGKTYTRVLGLGLGIVSEPEWASTTYQLRDEEAALARPEQRDELGGVRLRGKREIRAFQYKLDKASNGRNEKRFQFGGRNR